MRLTCPHCGVLLTGREGSRCHFCGEPLSEELMEEVRSQRAVYDAAPAAYDAASARRGSVSAARDGSSTVNDASSDPYVAPPEILDPDATVRIPTVSVTSDAVQRSYVSARPDEEKRQLPVGLMILVAVLFVVVVGIGVAFATGAASLPNIAQGTGQASPQAVPGSSSDGGTAGEGQESGAQDSESGQDAEAAAPSVQPKKKLSAYSWQELSEIADLIAACDSEAEAYSLAADYNLVKKGSLTGETKKIELSDGSQVKVRIVGIYHDETKSGEAAGLTFCSSAPVTCLVMNKSGTNDGGWKESDLRAYLQDELRPLLPDDLRECLVPVMKLTNNKGYAEKPSCVSATEDELWCPSFVEVVGPITKKTLWYKPEDVPNYNIYNEEGKQYQYFADLGVKADDPADGAVVYSYEGQKVSWWMRTSTPSTSTKYHVSGSDGDQTVSDEAGAKNGVVFGFCL